MDAPKDDDTQDPISTLPHHPGPKFHEVFSLKPGQYSEFIATRISEMMESNSLLNAPTQSLLSISNGIFDESIERKSGELPQPVACFLKMIVQEIERRFTTQVDHIRHQNNLRKAREEKYLSRIELLETLAAETRTKKSMFEEENIISDEEIGRLMMGKESCDNRILEFKQFMESTKKSYEQKYQQLEVEANGTKMELEKKIKDAELLLGESRSGTKELEAFLESKFQKWSQKEHICNKLMYLELQSFQELRTSLQTIKQEAIEVERKRNDEIVEFGMKLKVLNDAAENYHTVLLESRKLYNEVQELKGNIRVYCRIRPFLPEENKRSSIVDYISMNDELVVGNPSKKGKEEKKIFKFNKVYGPATTQDEVFLDIQPLVRSVLDGFNVCIFAYGQTGSGKTYTMSGPDSATKEEWGVNYRALNDLFHISQTRRNAILYEIGVQMIEIYNEQVRDLLANDASQKRLGILSNSQPNGLAVPDASLHSVKSITDVLGLMQIGQKNRAMSATALNTSSSRSHSVVTIHVQGNDLNSRATLYGSLHLIDLAGSERVDRSEVTGDRLKEAQHINKSLSALGDVIFALSQKNTHVPYRNSKLTQVLQSSLGGHAKTLMFVQINPDPKSYSESLSTLKFAERVSGVELGAACSNKEGNDVRDLMEQVVLLKETVARKDEVIEHLQTFTDAGTLYSRIISQHTIGTKKKSVNRGQEKHSGEESCQTAADLLCFNGTDSEEWLSDISDGDLSHMGEEAEDSMSSTVEHTVFSEQNNIIQNPKQRISKFTPREARSLQQIMAQETSSRSNLNGASKPSTLKGTLKSHIPRVSSKPTISKDASKSPSIRKISSSPATLSSFKATAKR